MVKALYGKFEQAVLRAKQLRKSATPAEQKFWELVRAKRFGGKKFYRQYPVSYELRGRTRFFFLDFYCHEERLVVELDGSIHEQQQEYDKARTELLNGKGLRVLRIKNQEMKNPEKVKLMLSNAFRTQPFPIFHDITPSLSKRGGKGESSPCS